jgi:uncharacterized membrane protein
MPPLSLSRKCVIYITESIFACTHGNHYNDSHMTNKTLNRIIFVLAMLGVIMGVYFLQSFLRQSSIICLNGNGCETVRRSAASWPFGIPVPAFGVVGYSIMVILAFLRTMKEKAGYLKGILGVAIFGVCFVTWFTLTEIFVIHGICTWCAVSAVNMYIIFFLTLASFKAKKG